MDDILNKLAAIYYPVFFLSAISLNILMYFLIFTKTTVVFKTMKNFLLLSNTFTMILACLAFCLQSRLVNNTSSLAIMGQGYCKYFGAEVCIHNYILMVGVGTVTGILNVNTLYYRSITISDLEESGIIRRLALFSLHYSLPIIIVIFYNTTDMNHSSVVYNMTLLEHPDYHLEPYGDFGGFVNGHNVFAKSITYLLALIVIYGPFFGYFCKRNVRKILNCKKSSFSAKTKSQVKTLVNGLTLQIVSPIICYMPTIYTYAYNKYSGGEQIIFSQYLYCFLISLPSIIDPLSSIYFIVPYRNAVRQMIGISLQARSRQISVQ